MLEFVKEILGCMGLFALRSDFGLIRIAEI